MAVDCHSMRVIHGGAGLEISRTTGSAVSSSRYTRSCDTACIATSSSDYATRHKSMPTLPVVAGPGTREDHHHRSLFSSLPPSQTSLSASSSSPSLPSKWKSHHNRRSSQERAASSWVSFSAFPSPAPIGNSSHSLPRICFDPQVDTYPSQRSYPAAACKLRRQKDRCAAATNLTSLHGQSSDVILAGCDVRGRGGNILPPSSSSSSSFSRCLCRAVKRGVVDSAVINVDEGYVEEEDTTSVLKDDSEEAIKDALVQLRNGQLVCGATLKLPRSLSPAKRAYAHDVAERLGLEHCSEGIRPNRRLVLRRREVLERLRNLREMVDDEEAASRALLSTLASGSAKSGQLLEAQGLLLRGVVVIEKEAAAFGRERWVLGKQVGVEQDAQMSNFMHRARPGCSIRLAIKNAVGDYVPDEEQPAARAAWSRRNRICIIFDSPPGENAEDSEEGRGKGGAATAGQNLNLLIAPDSLTFDRFRSVITECERADKEPLQSMTSVLLGTSLDLDRTMDDGDSVAIGRSQRNVSFLDESLNEEQRLAVRMCVDGPPPVHGSRSPVVLLHGPFGTGKTRTLVEVVRQRLALQERVLVAAASNAAVDNIALALLEADPDIQLARAGLTERVSPLLASHTLDSLRESLPESDLARKLRKEAHAAAAAANKWVRAADGGERRRAARKEAGSLFKDARRLEKAAAMTVLRRTSVLCGTLTGFATSLHDISRTDDGTDFRRFDCVIIDEASQATTPAVLMTLPYIGVSGKAIRVGEEQVYSGQTNDEKLRPLMILGGDHRQLPPTVISGDATGYGADLAATLFEELMERDGGGLGTWSLGYGNSAASRANQLDRVLDMAKEAACFGRVARHVNDDRDGEEGRGKGRGGCISCALTVQYRMPPGLMAYPSAAFYGGALIADRSTRSLPCIDSGTLQSDGGMLRNGCWLEVIDTAGSGYDEETSNTGSASAGSRSSKDGESFSTSNKGQAEVTARAVKEIVEFGLLGPGKRLTLADVAVITPYSAQVMVLREMLSAEVNDGLEIDSIDGFQGREKAVVVLDCVRSNSEANVGFLSDYRRLNVAITRARNKLVVIGDSATLAADPVWSLFFDWASAFSNHPCKDVETSAMATITTGGDDDHHDDAPTERFAYRSVFELPPVGGW